MIGLRISARIEPLERLDTALTDAPRTVDKLVGGIVTDFDNRVFAELTTIPPPHPFPYGEFPWTMARQKRAFFATNGFGRGIPTTRTGRIAGSWDIRQYRRGSIRGFTIRNTHPAARYLYGTLNIRSRRAAIRPQQRFHRITGWPVAHDVVVPATFVAVRRLKAGLYSAFERDVGISIKRRSFRA